MSRQFSVGGLTRSITRTLTTAVHGSSLSPVLNRDPLTRQRGLLKTGGPKEVSMAENKTRPTGASVADYIASKANEQQRADCKELMAMLKKVTGQPPKMWGPSIVGFGSYRYTYASGRTGESALVGFSIRGRELVVYVDVDNDRQQALLSRLGQHKMGKVCLYFKQLADLDTSVLEKIVVGSIEETRRRYGRRGH
jgi:hypothetical protein